MEAGLTAQVRTLLQAKDRVGDQMGGRLRTGDQQQFAELQNVTVGQVGALRLGADPHH